MSDPLDTHLARLLHHQGRLDLELLLQSLEVARRGRARGLTLGRVLVDQGVMSTEELTHFVGWLEEHGRPPSADPEAPSTIRPGRQATMAQDTALRATPAPTPQRRFDPYERGAMVGEYRLVDRLGAGAMGVVYLVEHLRTGQRQALKTLSLTADEDLANRLRREAEAQARIDGHPNVVRVHGFEEVEGKLHLYTELCVGGDLLDRLKGGALPIPEAVRIALGLAWGLSHMHDRGVIHRDLKPANVLFGADGTPKLVDFGLARFEGAQTLTKSDMVVGTPAYMAPEQALADRDRVGPPADVYALGAVLYQMLTGEFLFRGATSIEILSRVISEDPVPPRALRREIPAALEEICLEALAKDPEMRPSAAAFARQLERFLHSGGETPRGLGARRSFFTWMGLVTLVVGLLSLGAALALWAGPRLDGESPSEDSEQPPPPAGNEPPTSPAKTKTTAKTTKTAAPVPTSTLTWTAQDGRILRYRLSSYTESRWAFLEPTMSLESRTELELTWRLEQAGGFLQVEATIERLVFDWSLKGRMNDASKFDSNLAGDPLAAARGLRFRFRLDPLGGGVTEVEGIDAIRDALDRGQDLATRRRTSIPGLRSSAAMRKHLNYALKILPPQGADRRKSYTLSQDPLDLVGLRGGGGGAGLRAPQPPSLQPRVQVVSADASALLIWATQSGRRDLEGYPLDQEGRSYQVHPWVERTLEGRARFREGRLEEVRIEDRWKGEIRIESNDGAPVHRPVRGCSGTSTIDLRLLTTR